MSPPVLTGHAFGASDPAARARAWIRGRARATRRRPTRAVACWLLRAAPDVSSGSTAACCSGCVSAVVCAGPLCCCRWRQCSAAAGAQFRAGSRSECLCRVRLCVAWLALLYGPLLASLLPPLPPLLCSLALVRASYQRRTARDPTTGGLNAPPEASPTAYAGQWMDADALADTSRDRDSASRNPQQADESEKGQREDGANVLASSGASTVCGDDLQLLSCHDSYIYVSCSCEDLSTSAIPSQLQESL